ncbi:MAG TPA: Uma2 family endonuclease [Promineifilum sp.]|nr:Uma2 family endonuclease [Promineifilum sp.]
MIAGPVEQVKTVEAIRRRFTVADFLRMVEVGLLAEDDRVELLWGDIVEMSPINVAHASTVSRLLSVLSKTLGERVILSVQNPVQLDNESLPQPDIALLRPRDDFYSTHYPEAKDVFLLIEVSDSTLNYDRWTKTTLYGTAGIADYWIVNLPAQRIEVYREPRPDGYRTVTYYARGEMLSLLSFPDVELNVTGILGAD